MGSNTIQTRKPLVSGAVLTLSISALFMTVPGLVLGRPLGWAPAIMVVLALLLIWISPSPAPTPVRTGRRGAQWIRGTSVLEGVATFAGLVPCVIADQLRWWFPLVLVSVAIHLTTFLIWARRWVDLILVPVSWAAVGVALVLTAQGQWHFGWVQGGWVMSLAVLGYAFALATPVGNKLCGLIHGG